MRNVSWQKIFIQRHINNQNIHNGSGQVVSYLEYSMGIEEGKYRPQKIPQFTRSETPYLSKIEAEVENQIVREIAKRIYNQLTPNKVFFDNLEKVATDSLIGKYRSDILNGSS